jgi:hypothetical protein
MRLQWRWKLRTWMVLIAVVAVLIPGSKIIFDYWENWHIRTIIVNDPKKILNPRVFKDGVIRIDMRRPSAKREIQFFEETLQDRNLSYQIK